VPQLVKGGKWVFGWSIMDPAGAIPVPPEAFAEYGFAPGERAVVLRGSCCSGGFAIARSAKLAQSKISRNPRAIGRAEIGTDRRIVCASSMTLQPGERLLAVRGSGLALAFLQRGPIYVEARKHPEVEEWC
jgi:hypothetical protein